MPSPASEIPLYNSRILHSFVKLLRSKYPHVAIAELLSHAGVKECEVADQGHWFTQRQVDLFHEKLCQLTGNNTIAREAGRFAAYSDSLGIVREILLGLVRPEYVLLVLSKLAANFSRSSTYKARRIGPCEIEITVSFAEGVTERPYQCENRMGYFETIFLLFDHDYPEIEHSECIFKGGDVCRYRISWRPSRPSLLVMAGRLSSLLLLILLVPVARLNPLMAVMLLCAVVVQQGLSVWGYRKERNSLLDSLAGMRNNSERLLAQVQLNYDSALMINEVGKAISRKIELQEILWSVNQILQKRLHYGRGIILLSNRDKTALVLRSSFGLKPEDEQMLKRMEQPLDAPAQAGLFVRCFQRQEPFLVNGLVQVEELSRPENYAFFERLGVRSFICAPIVCEGESLGVLAVDSREGDLLQSDLNLIQGVAPVLGGAIKNAMHLASQRDLSDQLRRASELLERRVEERTAALSRAHEELRALYDSVSHDLRTPLRIIYGYGELLLDGYGDRLDKTATGYLQSMIEGGEQMEATLDKLLEYSKVRCVGLTLQRVDLSAMASRILSDLTVTDKRRILAARVQEGICVTGDEGMLKSVLENLLGNAWKYSAGRAVSSIEFGMKNGVCYVRDNGAGFDMSYSHRLFLPFHRLHDSRSFTGHGLGLATVRRIVERLGGKVWAEGKPDEGATFYFTISDRDPAAALPPAEACLPEPS